MKTTKILSVAMLAVVLLASCGKENTGRIRIMSENMTGGAKVVVDTANIRSGSAWTTGEYIDINGYAYPIVIGDDDRFYVNVESNPPEGDLYSVYPAAIHEAGGNDVSVVNACGSGMTQVTLNRLVVKFNADYTKHEVIFPMATKAAEGSTSLLFQHLTAGMLFSMKAATSTVSVASLKVVVQGTAAANDVVLDGVTYRTRWAVQGPTMPSGELGGIDGDRDITFASEMYFDMEDAGHDYVTVGATPVKFCVPVTISDLKRLSVTGFASDGSQVFSLTKEFTPDQQDQYDLLARNRMYRIPIIEIN